jgi:hypothetical protein
MPTNTFTPKSFTIMKSLLRLVFLTLLLLTPLRLAHTQSSPLPADQTITVGGLTTQANSQAWAYLFWDTAAVDLLSSRTYAIWQKNGSTTSTSPFTKVGIVTLQSDPKAVAGIIDRAKLALGEDTAALDQTMTGLFEKLMPTLTDVPAAERTAVRVSAVLRGVGQDLKKLQTLLLAARLHPSIALCTGHGYATKIPSSGTVTFEIREVQPADQTEVAVLGRITLNHAAPVALPAPTLVHQVPDAVQASFNNLNLKLVWDSPNELRRLLPLSQGHNLYRVKRMAAEALNWHVPATRPTSIQLAQFAAAADGHVRRCNSAPISARKAYSAAEVILTQPGDQFFVDDHLRMPGYPAPSAMPKHGDQYYYFATTRDRLGRENVGQASPGTLCSFCDRTSPPAPQGLKAEHEHTFNGGVTTDRLRISWKANDNSSDKKTTAYLVYRWAKSDGPTQPTGNPPLPISLNPQANLIAGPLPHVANQSSYTILDTGAGAPSLPADVNRTFWYTVRAIDDAAVPVNGVQVCHIPPFGGNISPNSPPVPGTLRDRIGPAAPSGEIQVLCPLPQIALDKTDRSSDPTLDPSLRSVDLICQRPPLETAIAAVDYERLDGATWIPLGRTYFSDGAASLTKRLTFPPTGITTGISIRSRVVTALGELSPYARHDFLEPPALTLQTATWIASVAWVRAPLSRCRNHARPNPGSGVTPPEGSDVIIQFTPPATTKQYKVYSRIDRGPLTLVKEDSGAFDPMSLILINLGLSSAATVEACLFLQVYDQDGNPSSMTPLGCIIIQGQPLPKPMLAPIGTLGTESAPEAQLQWFCPPPGIDHFEVWVAATPDLPTSLTPLLYQDAALPTATVMEPIAPNLAMNVTYQIYHTEHLGPLFGDGSLFTVNFPVEPGQKLRVKVRAVSAAGEKGPFSNKEKGEWSPPPSFTGPDVPWPARPLPPTSAASLFTGTVRPVFEAQDAQAGVIIGGIDKGNRQFIHLGRTVSQIQTTDPIESFLYVAQLTDPDGTRTALPCALFRTQVPDDPDPPSKPLANYPIVPGDVIQVSPLIETIATAVEPWPTGGTGVTIYDPFVSLSNRHIVLKDTTPVISGARYVYLLTLFDPVTKEISRVIPLPAIDIP